MPTYDYICESCKYGFERFQSITAKPLSMCPKCGKRKVKRLIGAGAGFIFKGNGFYTTDYRSEAYKSDAKKDKATPSSSPSKSKESTPKSDAKSSPKTGE